MFILVCWQSFQHALRGVLAYRTYPSCQQILHQKSMQFQLWIVNLHILGSVGTDTLGLDWQSDLGSRFHQGGFANCQHTEDLGGNFVKIKFDNRIIHNPIWGGSPPSSPQRQHFPDGKTENPRSFSRRTSHRLFFRPDFGQIYCNELIVSQTPHYLCEYSKRTLQKQIFNICSQIPTFLNEFPGITISKLKVFSKVKDKWNEFSENPLTRGSCRRTLVPDYPF